MQPTDYRSMIKDKKIPVKENAEDTYCSDDIEVEEPIESKSEMGINWLD